MFYYVNILIQVWFFNKKKYLFFIKLFLERGFLNFLKNNLEKLFEFELNIYKSEKDKEPIITI